MNNGIGLANHRPGVNVIKINYIVLSVNALVIYFLVKMYYDSLVTFIMFINNNPLYFDPRKIRGSLKICSKSVIFEPDTISQPIIKVNAF